MNWPTDNRRDSNAQRRFSMAVLERDDFTCQVRGPQCLGEATEADHIVARSLGGSDDLSNGRAICSACHRRITQIQALKARMTDASRARRRAKRYMPGEQHPGLR